MKKLLFVFFVFSTVFAFADSLPDWIKNPEKSYPKKEYIRAVGEGSSENAAKNAAIAQISLFFETKTEIVNLALKQSSQIVTEEKALTSSNASLTQIAKITSTADFFCLNFTESVYDKKTDNFTILAYIKKAEVAEIYKTRISALLHSIKLFKDYSSSEKELFLSAAALQKASVFGSLCERYIKALTVIYPMESSNYENDLKMIASIQAERNAIKKQLSFSIQLLQNDKVFNPVFTTISEILEKQGYSYSTTDAKYKIVADIACAEEIYDAGPFIRPSVEIIIHNQNGIGVYSYSKSLPRIGSKTMDQAYIRAVSKITQDLKENFLSE